ncbi:MAG: type VII toxin-antitoxin system HepT family RNase toxin [Natronosporangium sp.]
MVDEERLTRLASGVLADLARLRALATTADLVGQPDQLDAVKYRFVTAIEGCIGIAHHITASEGWAAPDSNAAAVRGMAEHAIIDRGLANTVASAAGFRNLLVHQYGTIDDTSVVEFLGQLDELDRYVREVLAWVTGRSSGASPELGAS